MALIKADAQTGPARAWGFVYLHGNFLLSGSRQTGLLEGVRPASNLPCWEALSGWGGVGPLLGPVGPLVGLPKKETGATLVLLGPVSVQHGDDELGSLNLA